MPGSYLNDIIVSIPTSGAPSIVVANRTTTLGRTVTATVREISGDLDRALYAPESDPLRLYLEVGSSLESQLTMVVSRFAPRPLVTSATFSYNEHASKSCLVYHTIVHSHLLRGALCK